MPFHTERSEAAEHDSLVREMAEIKKKLVRLEAREDRYERLFEESPVSLWEEDFSEVIAHLRRLRQSGVSDFAAFFADHPEVLAQLSQQVKVLNVNRASVEMFEAEDKNDLMTQLPKTFTDSSYTVFAEELVVFAQGHNNFRHEGEVITLKGRPLNVMVDINLGLSSSPYLDTETLAIVSMVDITERKQAEAVIQEVNRSYRMLSACNKVLVRARREMDISKSICELIVETGGYRLAWIGLVHRDGTKRIRPVASAGFDDGYLESLNLTWADSERGRGPSGTAVRSGEPYIARRIKEDPGFGPWRQAAIQRDYASSIALPLKDQGAVFGVLNIYAQQESSFAEAEVQLLRELADNLAYGIAAQRMQLKKKQAEEALLESELKLRTMFESARDAIGVSKNGLHTMVNPAYLDMFRYKNEEQLVGVHILELIAPREHERIKRHVRARTRGECAPNSYETIGLRRDGLEFDMEVRVSSYDMNDEAFTVATLRDITARKKAQRELHESETRFRMLYDRAPDMYVTVNPVDDTILLCNQTFLDQTGYGKDDVIGRSVHDLYHPDCVAQAKDIYKAFKENAPVFGTEWVIVGKGGQPIDVSLNINAVRDKDGHMDCVILSWRNITEQRRSDREKEKLEERLRQSQKVEAIGRLAGGVAHDFNNMLGVILGYGELLLDELHSGDPLRDKVQQIVRAGTRSADLTRQLLAFSRRQRLNPKVIDINHLLLNLEKMLRRLIGEDIDLVLDYGAQPLWVCVDPGQLEQVIVNLAVNARDAMPSGGRLNIQTTTRIGDDDSVWVSLIVKDTGLGMDPETLVHLFEPFYTTKEAGKGTGLGLATAYGIVKQSGGDIFVVSQSECGSQFEITLPSVEAGDGEKVGHIEKRPEKGTGQHILVAEDEDTLRGLLKESLVGLEYQVTVAANGGEALLLVEEQGLAPDMLITDVVMPGMSGSVLGQRLLRSLPDLKILYISGYSDEMTSKHGIDDHMHFIQKPFSLRSLSQNVAKLLET